MDIIYDKVQNNVESYSADSGAVTADVSISHTAPKLDEPSPPSKPEVDSKTQEINQKTDEQFVKLEKTVENTYNYIGSAFGSFWGKVKTIEIPKDTQQKLQGLKSNLPELVNQKKTQLEEQIGNLKLQEKIKTAQTNISRSINPHESEAQSDTQTKEQTRNVENVEEDKNNDKKMLDILVKTSDDYLNSLDKELEKVESNIVKYASAFGNFLKTSVIEIQPEEKNIDERLKKATHGTELNDIEADILFNVPENLSTQINATRTEAQINTLHTSQDLYITEAIDEDYHDFKKSFHIQNETDEISALLKKYPNLQNLMSSIVPTKVTYEEFWSRYFFMKNQITNQEKHRKALLQNTTTDDEEDFDWGDDDEDDEYNDKTNKTDKPGKTDKTDKTDKIEKTDDTDASKKPFTNEGTKPPKKGYQKDIDTDDDDDWE
ncbi:Dos2p [Ascoidea rubescens DSM 1968]|uniref:BSD-domain-containing protein n=1 Tax=Ascoidea rubescens DSM 1968 TaxID=1344418 RepID=A0A1D2VP57_9ASCO|nr:BSD-domain-containing protein [Ascoidea rubescens DSM 1968]ODV63393.1 BSD-domain-containing protein [Ascoidea rubescens DSM 1968]